MEWERVVNRVAKVEVGEKMIVCGRAARWWDGEIRDKRHEVYRKMVSGQKELWSEYCRLHKEVKETKENSIWNEVIEKTNADFEGSRKEFWAFVSRRLKGKKKNIASLKNEGGISVTSTRGKLQMSVWVEGSNFDDDWNEEFEDRVNNYCKCASELFEDEVLDKII